MNNNEHDLHAEAIMLATKALEVISKTLDIIAGKGEAQENSSPEEHPAPNPIPEHPSPNPSPYRGGGKRGDSKPISTSEATTEERPTPNPIPEHPSPNPSPYRGGGRGGESQQKVTTQPDTSRATSPAQPDTYRADAIRFNEQFLSDHYDLRYNTMLKTTEFRPKDPVQSDNAITPLPPRGGVGGEASPWHPITERDLNALTVDQLLAGGQSWSYGMRLCIDSARVESYDPVKDYLDHLPQWDRQHDYIAELAARVPTAYDAWPALFRRWLLAMVAQVRGMSPDHGNSLVPMLIGAQGTGKSTFCKMLLPRHLRQYYMDDIKMDNAEQVERVLGRMWLVNIDEYDSKTQREQAKIKRLLTERDVQVRRPRSDQYTLTQRVCSFIATTNDNRPLTDPTGSRRYLCVELTGAIDTTTPLDHDQLFAQALWLLEQGEPFFLTREEEAEMEAHNEQYCRIRVLEKAVRTLLEPAPVAKETLMTATDIMNILADSLRPQDMPSPKQLAAALRSIGMRQGAQQGQHGWYARVVSK